MRVQRSVWRCHLQYRFTCRAGYKYRLKASGGVSFVAGSFFVVLLSFFCLSLLSKHGLACVSFRASEADILVFSLVCFGVLHGNIGLALASACI